MERERIEGQGDFSDFVAIFEQAFTTLQENGNEEGLGRSLWAYPEAKMSRKLEKIAFLTLLSTENLLSTEKGSNGFSHNAFRAHNSDPKIHH